MTSQENTLARETIYELTNTETGEIAQVAVPVGMLDRYVAVMEQVFGCPVRVREIVVH